MANIKKSQNHPNLPLLLIALFESLVLFGLILFGPITPLPPRPSSVDLVNSQEDTLQKNIINQLPTWLPNTSWSAPFAASYETPYGTFQGTETTTTITTDSPTMRNFEDEKFLNSLGLKIDTMLLADGPGSSMWGYKKEINGKIQTVLFFYKTTPTSTPTDEPIQFNCPCQTKVTVFISNPLLSTK